MKLLIYRYGSICEPDVISGFEELGFEVLQMTDEILRKDITPQECIQNLSQFLLDHPVDFVFTINFFPSISEVCNIFHLPYLSWTVDSPVMELFTKSIQNSWNRVFLFDRTSYNEIHPLNPDCVFHLPLAANFKDKQEVILHAKKEDLERFSHDISFVGSLYTEKCAFDRLQNPSPYMKGYLDAIMEAQLRVYGYYFIEELLTNEIVEDFKNHFPYFYCLPGDNFLSDRYTLANLYIGSKITVMERDTILRHLSKFYEPCVYTASDTSAYPKVHNLGLAKSLEEMPLIFYGSKINLNPTSKSIRSGLPLRIFDILSCGGFCMTNYQSELEDYFKPGAHLDCYASMEELEDKIAYYLNHDNDRREIAINGLYEIKKRHSYPIRLEQMLEKAFHLK